jgi:hypothetical protein
MAIFTVYAKRIEWLKVEVEAENQEKAMELAEGMPGEEFEDMDDTMEFEITEAVENDS